MLWSAPPITEAGSQKRTQRKEQMRFCEQAVLSHWHTYGGQGGLPNTGRYHGEGFCQDYFSLHNSTAAQVRGGKECVCVCVCVCV